MFSSFLNVLRRSTLWRDRDGPRNRERYYMRHQGLRPLITINRHLSDTNGLRYNEGTNEDGLMVTDIDLNISKNSIYHNCDRFDITKVTDPDMMRQTPKLVVRRGFSFELTLRFNRVYRKGNDKVFTQLAFGNRPKAPKKTMVRIPLEYTNEKEWNSTVTAINQNELTLELTSPSDCFVGVWRLSIYVVEYNKATLSNYKEIFMLFNPFNKDDDVFMYDSHEREEYVMNDYGMIVTGSYESNVMRPWSFSQFYGHVLEQAMFLLDQTDLPYTDRGDPVLVSRRLASMVNDSDDAGVLVGRWDGKYADGTTPVNWQGSVRILEQYWRTRRPVKYGQCWVFSGLLTTLCRAIGIPCRCVTNFSSAHDTDSSVTVDHFFNEYFRYDEFMNEDSIWSFHVWNDVYMTRPDLPVDSYGGWQALDSTPQETSDGLYCCGPCPLLAIKHGDSNSKYDAPFMIAEVNAHLIRWAKNKDGEYEMGEIATNEIGKAQVTKTVARMGEHDITYQYKFPEGSNEERAFIYKAISSGSRGFASRGSRSRGFGSRASPFTGARPEDVEVELIFDKDTPIGSDLTTKLTVSNISSETRTVTGNYSIETMYYTGTRYVELQNEPIYIVLKAHAKETFSTLTRYEKYIGNLADHDNIKVEFVCDVEETKQKMFLNKIFNLKRPALLIDAPYKAKLRVRLIIEMSFTNPLPVQLTQCSLNLTGNGLTHTMMKRLKDVGAGEVFATKLHITPRSKGKHYISIMFTSNELKGISGLREIEIDDM